MKEAEVKEEPKKDDQKLNEVQKLLLKLREDRLKPKASKMFWDRK